MPSASVPGASKALCTALRAHVNHGIPDAVSETAKAVILDGIGCLFGGLGEEPSKISRRYVTAVASREESSVVGLGRRVDAASAAFANGVVVHSLDFDATGSPACHSTASVLPAVLALAERSGASGRDLICAFALGWEVECRLRMAGGLRSAFHPMAVYGPVAAAAASAVLLGLDAEGIESAVAISASAAGGLAANGQTPVKVIHAGSAARAGVLAALQAQQGLTGAPGVLERAGGYGDAFFAEVDWSKLGADADLYLTEDHVSFKPYPVQLPMLNVIDTVLDARSANFDLAGFGRLEIIGSPVVASRSNPRPARGHAGKFSPEFCAAVALVFGSVGIDAFADRIVSDPRIIRVMDRTTVTGRPEAGFHEVTVRLRGADGDIREVSRAHQRGSKLSPLSAAQRMAKVRGCLTHAGVAGIADDLFACVEKLETAEDVSRLGTILRTPAPRG